MTYATLERRREAREAVEGPGKFEGEPAITAILYAISLDGGADEIAGDVETIGYCERFGRYVLMTDSQGFVVSRRFRTVALAEAEIEYARNLEDSIEEGDFQSEYGV